MQRLHVDEMLAELSSHEFGEWLAWFQLEPRDGKRLEPYLAQLGQLIYNANWTKKADFEKFVFDFEPKEVKPHTPQEEAELIKAMFMPGTGVEEIGSHRVERIQ